ncbi:hypothetical protein CYMTET_11857 [Cymbomonas tetramitiformis]|uniref:Glycosyl transferase CAP10 domain-containing protein n=1 Tax=Cymbomonas tetramitiformis TaxID=36881 RepID=A0AAE0LD19_9CHLO|nr:hypothetical protein CYMTET_11857 [Cymbomonas tetramitiformis]
MWRLGGGPADLWTRVLFVYIVAGISGSETTGVLETQDEGATLTNTNRELLQLHIPRLISDTGLSRPHGRGFALRESAIATSASDFEKQPNADREDRHPRSHSIPAQRGTLQQPLQSDRRRPIPLRKTPPAEVGSHLPSHPKRSQQPGEASSGTTQARLQTDGESRDHLEQQWKAAQQQPSPAAEKTPPVGTNAPKPCKGAGKSWADCVLRKEIKATAKEDKLLTNERKQLLGEVRIGAEPSAASYAGQFPDEGWEWDDDIKEYLAPWSTPSARGQPVGITRELLDEVMVAMRNGSKANSWYGYPGVKPFPQSYRAQVIDGELWVEDIFAQESYREFAATSKLNILHAIRHFPVPDVDILVNQYDFSLVSARRISFTRNKIETNMAQVCPGNHSGQKPARCFSGPAQGVRGAAPIFSSVRAANTYDLPFPDFSFMFPKADHHLQTPRWEEVHGNVLAASKEIPWEQKVDRAVWSGNAQGQVRETLAILAAENPDLLYVNDVFISQSKQFNGRLCTDGDLAGSLSGQPSLPRHCKVMISHHLNAVASVLEHDLRTMHAFCERANHDGPERI